MNKTNYQFLRDPLCLSRVLWPKVKYYNKQVELIYSVWHNKETIGVAGNMLGKDFVAGRIALMFFLTRNPCHVVTSSVDHTQLEGVLWGEIRAAIQESEQPLLWKDGGPLEYNHLHIRKKWTYGRNKGEYDPISYLIGRQSKSGEGMLGHHVAEIGDEIPRTLFIGDEASGLDDITIDRAETWADRILLIGNPYPCNNRFFRGVESGDLLSKRMVKYWEGITLWTDIPNDGSPTSNDLRETNTVIPYKNVPTSTKSQISTEKSTPQNVPASTTIGTSDKSTNDFTEKQLPRVPPPGGPLENIKDSSSPIPTSLPEKDNGKQDRSFGYKNKQLIKEVPRVQQYTRKIIHISCDDSPNVRLGKAQEKNGQDITNEIMIPGVMSYWKYKEREQIWDDVKKCIQLYGKFYKGSELLLFPPHWLNSSEQMESSLFRKRRVAKAIGCDPGEGKAETVWYVVDDWGILDEIAILTPDTSEIRKQTIYLMRKWTISPECVMLDAGGGHQHADYLREAGYDVQTVAFGEAVIPKPKRGMTSIEKVIHQREEKYQYLNRRAQMYGHLSNLIEPIVDIRDGHVTDYPTASERFARRDGTPDIEKDTRDATSRFCIPTKYLELRRQLSLIPKVLDREGRMKLPPKNRVEGSTSKEKTLTEIIGRSPDRADALVVAVYCRDFGSKRPRAGAAT